MRTHALMAHIGHAKKSRTNHQEGGAGILVCPHARFWRPCRSPNEVKCEVKYESNAGCQNLAQGHCKTPAPGDRGYSGYLLCLVRGGGHICNTFF